MKIYNKNNYYNAIKKIIDTFYNKINFGTIDEFGYQTFSETIEKLHKYDNEIFSFQKLGDTYTLIYTSKRENNTNFIQFK